jgi:HTH-type transcriptional regulator/antitoxin HigA
MKTAEDFAKLPDQMRDAGVRLGYVEALPGAKIDGCAMFLDGNPVVGLSGRGKRLDKVLFTLLHEIAHILRGRWMLTASSSTIWTTGMRRSQPMK